MSRHLFLAILFTLGLGTPLLADWNEARAEALKAVEKDAEFKKAATALLDTDSPMAIKDFVQKYETSHKSQVARVLVAFLHHKTPVFRMAAIGWLNKVGDPSVLPEVVKAMKTADANVKGMAAAFVGRFSGNEIVPLLKPLLSDPDVEVRYSALAALASTRDESLAPIMAGALGDEDKKVSQMAGQYLSILLKLDAWLTEGATPTSSNEPHATLNDTQRLEVLKAAQEAAPELADALNVFFNEPTGNAALDLIRQSGEIQGPVAQALAAGLADDREPVLLACLKGLERLGLPETAEAVTALFIADGRTSVKIAAARALKRALSYSAR